MKKIAHKPEFSKLSQRSPRISADTTGGQIPCSIVLDENLLRMIKAHANEEKMPVSDWIERALRRAAATPDQWD